MQILFPIPIGLLAALTPAERVAEIEQAAAPALQPLRENLTTLLLLFVLGQALAILSYWIASKIVTNEEGRFVNALKVYGFYILMIFLLSAGGAFSVYAAETMTGPSPGVGAHLISVGVIIIFGLLMVVSLFTVPMKVYSIGFPQSIAFVLIWLVVQVAGNLALNNTLGRDVVGKDSPLQKALAKMAQAASSRPSDAAPRPTPDADSDEKIAGDKTKPITERQTALKDLYGRLDAMYHSLPPGQSDARMDYDTRKARYERLLADLREDAIRGR